MSDSDDKILAPVSEDIDSWSARARKWVLLDGNRLLVAGATMAALSVSFGALVSSGLVPLHWTQPVFYVFSALIGGNMTLITVVVSINQLLLSREMKSPGELESQIEEGIEYRREVEDAADEVAPVQPLGF